MMFPLVSAMQAAPLGSCAPFKQARPRAATRQTLPSCARTTWRQDNLGAGENFMIRSGLTAVGTALLLTRIVVAQPPQPPPPPPPRGFFPVQIKTTPPRARGYMFVSHG